MANQWIRILENGPFLVEQKGDRFRLFGVVVDATTGSFIPCITNKAGLQKLVDNAPQLIAAAAELLQDAAKAGK